MQHNGYDDPASSAPKPKLLDRLRDLMRRRHYSLATEDAYYHWCRRFILFHNKRHPNEMGEVEVRAFLTHLAVEGCVAASTQNQAFSALLFLYQQILQIELSCVGSFRVVTHERLSMVLGQEEVRALPGRMSGVHRLISDLLYGSRLHLLEYCRLRIRSDDFLSADRGAE